MPVAVLAAECGFSARTRWLEAEMKGAVCNFVAQELQTWWQPACVDICFQPPELILQDCALGFAKQLVASTRQQGGTARVRDRSTATRLDLKLQKTDHGLPVG